MEIDGYHACPCHSEKKIKFCCGKEIIQDLNQLLAKQRAGQELAALDECERAIKKHGAQDCLLTMKTQLLLAHNELDKALEVNVQFREKNPHHPAGFHQLALLRLEKRDIVGAVDALQDAVDAVKGNEVPVFLINGFRMVGMALFVIGLPLAARAHFRFALYLSGDQDDEIKNLYLRTLVASNLSFAQRARLEFPELTESESIEEWAKKIVTAKRGFSRGQYRKSLKYLELASASFPDNEQILYSIAILCSCLSDPARTSEAWRRYALLPGLSEAKAILGLIMSNVHQPPVKQDRLGQVEMTFEITDFNAALERALSLNLLQAFDRPEQADEEGSPPPRNVFLVLDRPFEKGQPLTMDNTPSIVGSLSFYGKQTDRPARLVWDYQQLPKKTEIVKLVQEEFKPWFSGAPTEEVVDEETLLFNLMLMDWSIPSEISPVERSRLVPQLVLKRLKEWSTLPVNLLDGKSPIEAIQDPELGLRLKAILFTLQFDILTFELDEDRFTEFWDFLGLQLPSATKLDGRNVAELNPVEQACLSVRAMDDSSLSELMVTAYSMQIRPVLRRVLSEVLRRPDSDQLIPKHDAIQQLALLSTDLGQSLELFAQARSKAAQAGVPLGSYLVDEFEFRFAHGITEKLEELMTVIYQSHLQEPEVAERMSMILHRHGFSAAPSAPPTHQAKAARQAKPASNIIVGNESGSATTGASKLWLPD